MRPQPLRAALVAVVAGAGLVAVGVPAAAARAAGATAAPHVRLSPHSGPPTSTVRVSGAGFGAYRAVDIYFDTTDKALAATNGNGAFSGIQVRVPASAVPGTHYITAVQRHSGRSAQARFLVNTNWAQFGYSASHTGFNPYENVLSRSSVSGMGLDWSFTAGGGIETSPAVANGVVYTAFAASHLYALNAATGAKLWSFTPSGPRSSPAVANGVVYIGSFNGNLYALNAATGARLWSFNTGAAVDTAPAVANGVVYVESVGLYALNAATGAKLWSFAPADSDSSSPAVANGVVYAGSGDGNVYALNAATGAELWSFPIGGSVISSPAVANGVVYIGSVDGDVYALSADTGAKLWSFPTGGSVISSPAVANGVVYAASAYNNVYALSAATGARLWSFTTGGVDSSPAVANGMVYIAVDAGLYAFHLSGELGPVSRPAPGQLHPNHRLQPAG